MTWIGLLLYEICSLAPNGHVVVRNISTLLSLGPINICILQTNYDVGYVMASVIPVFFVRTTPSHSYILYPCLRPSSSPGHLPMPHRRPHRAHERVLALSLQGVWLRLRLRDIRLIPAPPRPWPHADVPSIQDDIVRRARIRDAHERIQGPGRGRLELEGPGRRGGERRRHRGAGVRDGLAGGRTRSSVRACLSRSIRGGVVQYGHARVVARLLRIVLFGRSPPSFMPMF